MKENKLRILFILIVLVIIGFAIFKIYGKIIGDKIFFDNLRVLLKYVLMLQKFI